MRTTIATLGVALLFSILATAVAGAAPTEVNVRIEGRGETLFEGPILTDGHNVRATSDGKAPPAGRRCNGLNNGRNPTPGPTPTAAGADAMTLVGEDFDGQWYAEPFEDYFIKRWGPDAQDEGNGEFWGLLVNNVFTDIGGCQFQLDAGDEVLWVYDTFADRPRLALYPAGYSGGPRLLTATAELGEPFEVEVDAWQGYSEGDPPAAPERSGSDPFEGALVAPVESGPGGFEAVDAGSPDAVTSGSDGRATIVFADPGWHRLKATVTGGAGEAAVRSNRLDVCVPEPPASDCGPLPTDDQVRVPPPVEPEGESESQPPDPSPPAGDPGAGSSAGGSAGTPPPGPGQVRLRLGRLDRSHLAQGVVRVSWRVLAAGVGISKWAVSSRALGRRGARYLIRARGTSASSASLHLPPGAVYQLQLTVTDALGRSSTAALGRVRVPA